MFLMQKNTEKLVEVLTQVDLFDPNHTEIVGRINRSESIGSLFLNLPKYTLYLTCGRNS
ncbi:hypothetical protein Ga0076813_12423 [endosymbiont of Ridgeia piscesae]|jgi:hypothetical protein|uniref:Uncharacterized protein n=1 Tax=endosymbiont of Ridgeia piscesae TaxID=54398 RepID=A0A0T5Z5T7_9GAMM|nr:hypothetical protein Ga0076813_12423 [endosymbiont of Ridgeia piscesae]